RPYWFRRRRYRYASSCEHRTKGKRVSEGFRTDLCQPLCRREQVGSREGNDGHALAVADHLRSDRLAAVAVQNTDQVRRGDNRPAALPRHDPFILEVYV